MLTNLHVKNLALIKESEVNFKEGLNILTGETGAGKSIIIGSINYALGAKASPDVIREGAEYALVELVFQLEREDLIRKVKEMELPIEDDGSIIITRKIMPARSSIRVCGETVTVKQVKDLAALLIDIHGQHEHQSLLQPKKQREVLDRFAGAEIETIKEKLALEVKAYREIADELEKLSMDDSAREREISLARYEVNEIEDAALKPGEEEQLEIKYRKMQNSKKIVEAVNSAANVIGNGESNALDFVGYGVRELNSAAAMDEELENVRDRLADAESILSDAFRDISRYLDNFSFGDEEFVEVEERLDLINTLILKYGDSKKNMGSSIENVLAYGEMRRTELDKLEDLTGYLATLKEKEIKKKEDILKLCEKIHKIRSKIAKNLSKEVTGILEELNFLKVNFEISVLETENFTSEGFDDICFNISLNPGEKLKPVAEVASGGELSRIMLALKTVFANKDETGTLIFDEIDTGISGRTAWKVSERMGEIAKEHQVICITHLPQIAAMADTHFMIEKSENAGKTETNIYPLDESKTLEEVARLLGSDVITEAVLTNAKELKDMANQKKSESK